MKIFLVVTFCNHGEGVAYISAHSTRDNAEKYRDKATPPTTGFVSDVVEIELDGRPYQYQGLENIW